MLISKSKSILSTLIALGLVLSPMSVVAADKDNKKNIVPVDLSIEKGAVAYDLGNDAAKSLDFEKAVKHWQTAAKDGNFYALWQLARFHMGIFNQHRDPKLAMNYLNQIVAKKQLKSKNGLKRLITSSAMVELAVFHLNGVKGLKFKQDPKLAIKYLQLAAASNGNAKANYILGELYFESKFVKSEKKRAVLYYTLAARKRYFPAQIKLGILYYKNGKNIQTKTEGLAWLLIFRETHPNVANKQVDEIIAQAQKDKKLIKDASTLSLQMTKKWKLK